MKEVIENRSVAIVGRAEYLNEIEQGELIDSHDVVIRTQSNLPWPHPAFVLEFDNDESFVPRDFQHLFGKKTTGFAPTNLPYWGLGDGRRYIVPLMERGCEYLIQHKVYNTIFAHEIATLDHLEDKFKIPIYRLPYDHFAEIVRALDYSFPMPGTLLIDYIKRQNPKSLYFTGFACYLDAKDAWLKAEVKMARDHKPLYDIRYLRDFVRQFDNVTTDDKLMEYFETI
ncbi:MAG: hypothetical protein OXN17_08250 [Candidatus Poribacteria bacterium]|nr:hypothetical protein [Candidatus Poribacteria bacterium]MDE0505616.1 hypothetical protein [Candidatus Poribacteria bacterium]